MRVRTPTLILLGFLTCSLNAVPVFPLGFVIGILRLHSVAFVENASALIDGVSTSKSRFAYMARNHQLPLLGSLLATLLSFLGLGVAIDVSGMRPQSHDPFLSFSLGGDGASVGVIVPTYSLLRVLSHDHELHESMSQTVWLLRPFRVCREVHDEGPILVMSYAPAGLACPEPMRIPRGTEFEIDNIESPSSGQYAGGIRVVAHATIRGRSETIWLGRDTRQEFETLFSRAPISRSAPPTPTVGQAIDDLYESWGIPDTQTSLEAPTALFEYWDLPGGVQGAVVDRRTHRVIEVVTHREYEAGEATGAHLRETFMGRLGHSGPYSSTVTLTMEETSVGFYVAPEERLPPDVDATVFLNEMLEAAVANYTGGRAALSLHMRVGRGSIRVMAEARH